MKKVVDCFRFFNEKELLELRYHMLKDYVDKFIILEGTTTFSGHPRPELLAKKFITELKLPEERFIIIEVDLPQNNEDTQNNNVDVALTSLCAPSGDSYKNSVNARTRERLLLDSLLFVTNTFEDDCIFIVSDCDEIVHPGTIDYLSSVAWANRHSLLKVPLVQLEGRADLRAWNKSTNNPQLFDERLFFCTKAHFERCTPTQMRYNIENPFPIIYVTEDGARAEDLGWHFSWMGDNARIKLKQKSTAHYADQIESALIQDLSSEELQEFMDTWKPRDGGLSPWGDTNVVLKNYSHENLPKEILEIDGLKTFFLEERETPIPVIGVPIVNGVHWLERLIDSIDYPVGELFIVNNNGRDQITIELDRLANKPHPLINKIRVCHLPHNIGVGGAWNLIIKSYPMAPHWIIANNDICFTPGLLQKMEKEASGSNAGTIHAQFASWGGGAYDLFLLKDYVVQSCGLFDENLYPAYAEDVDYSIRTQLKGIECSILDIAYLHGEQDYRTTGSQTHRIEPRLRGRLTKSRVINETQYMNKKWGENYFLNYAISQPYPTPFNAENYPISYTTYNLEFIRQKYLGF